MAALHIPDGDTAAGPTLTSASTADSYVPKGDTEARPIMSSPATVAESYTPKGNIICVPDTQSHHVMADSYAPNVDTESTPCTDSSMASTRQIGVSSSPSRAQSMLSRTQQWGKDLGTRTTAWCAGKVDHHAKSVLNTVSFTKRNGTTKKVPSAILHTVGSVLLKAPPKKKSKLPAKQKQKPRSRTETNIEQQQTKPTRKLQKRPRNKRTRSSISHFSDVPNNRRVILKPRQATFLAAGGYNDVWLITLEDDQRIKIAQESPSLRSSSTLNVLMPDETATTSAQHETATTSAQHSANMLPGTKSTDANADRSAQSIILPVQKASPPPQILGRTSFETQITASDPDQMAQAALLPDLKASNLLRHPDSTTLHGKCTTLYPDQPGHDSGPRQFILRIPNGEGLLPYQLSNEVAFLKYVKTNIPSIPVPEVYGYSTDKRAPFIAMEYIQDAEPLDDVWMTVSPETRSIIIEQIADINISLCETRFSHIGGMDPVTLEPAPTVECSKIQCGRAPLHSKKHYDIGPYRSKVDYAVAHYDKEIAAYTKGNRKAIEEKELFEDVGLSKKQFINELREKRDWLVEHPEAFTPDDPFVLIHGDLAGRNLMYRDGKIVSVLDWEFAGMYPLSTASTKIDLWMETAEDQEKWALWLR